MRISAGLVFIALLLASCKSAQKHYKDGNYDKAYNSALKDIKKGKKDRKTRSLLDRSFDKLLYNNRSEISSYLNTNQIEDMEFAYQLNDQLLAEYNEGKLYLDDDFDDKMDVVSRETEDLRNSIVTNYLDLADMQMEIYQQSGDKLAAQEACIIANKLIKDYDENTEAIHNLYQASKEAGTLVIMVLTNARYDYNREIDREFSRITRESEQFLDVVYNGNAREGDCILNIDFRNIVEYVRDNQRTENFTEEIEDGYDIERDTSGREVRIPRYRTVRGEVVITERATQYDWTINVLVDGYREYCDYRNRNINISESVVREYYDISGDTRAIPDRYQTRNQNSTIRNEDEVLEDMIEQAYDQFRRYYF